MKWQSIVMAINVLHKPLATTEEKTNIEVLDYYFFLIALTIHLEVINIRTCPLNIFVINKRLFKTLQKMHIT